MKTRITTIMLLFIIISMQSLAQERGGNGFFFNSRDSLPFDGAYTDVSLPSLSCGCPIKILHMSGVVYGTECVKKVSSVCGEKDTVSMAVKGLLPSFAHHISDGDSIRTGDFQDSQIELQLTDGKIIHMSQNTSLIINKDHCKNPMDLILHYGLIYLDLTKGDKNNTISTRTERGIIVNKGTRFTVEITRDGDNTVDIVRVYDGSVEFKLNPANKDYKKSNKDKDAEIKKLTEDYKNGKITSSEYSKKVLELSSSVVENIPKTVTVEAGYESRIVGFGNPSDPVAFDTSNDPGTK